MNPAITKINERSTLVKICNDVYMQLNGKIKEEIKGNKVFIVELNKSGCQIPILNHNLYQILDKIKPELINHLNNQKTKQISKELLQFVISKLQSELDNQNRFISVVLSMSQQNNIYVFENVVAQAEIKANFYTPSIQKQGEKLALKDNKINFTLIAAVH
eukprot:TRINITY_DN12969_c0_g1_i1.p1 TRINITY_DN12969_c0_g1~~TRINITY_DN12969_c0_g1_i1.p1  ORF type:complete len:160 (+),score=35.62 TRINITY_DN12969_c0_g1_i1:399-878(+)